MALANRQRPDQGGRIDKRMVVSGDTSIRLPVVDVLDRREAIAAVVAVAAAVQCLGRNVDGLGPGEGVQQVEPRGEALLHLGLQAVVIGGAPGQRADDRAEAGIGENAGL